MTDVCRDCGATEGQVPLRETTAAGRTLIDCWNGPNCDRRQAAAAGHHARFVFAALAVLVLAAAAVAVAVAVTAPPSP